jgi:DNA-binding protein HU-beta
MTKKEFLSYIAKNTNKPISQIDEVLSEMVKYITKTIAKGNKLTIPQLGTFSMKKRSARKGRNPQTGEAIKIAAKKVPYFSAGAVLKRAVNGK